MQHLISVCNDKSRHITDITPDNPNNFIVYYELKIYGIPDDYDEDQAEVCLDDETEGEFLGTVTGYMIYGEAIDRFEQDMYYLCDAHSETLENVTSALLGEPLEFNSNHFYIEEIDVKSDFDMLIKYLPAMLFTHTHTPVDILSYVPEPLPHEETIYEKVNRDIAEMAFLETQKRILGENTDNETQLIMSENQLNLMLGRRSESTAYPVEYKDRAVWEKYENAGFKEWKNTRVLYMQCD